MTEKILTKEKKSTHRNMGKEPVAGLLIKMSGPAMFSMIIQALYNIMDSIFVAHMGEDALASVSIVYPVQMLMIAFAVGTGIGINSVISRKLGAGDMSSAGDFAVTGLKLGLINWSIFALIGIFLSSYFVGLFAKDEIVFDYAVTYMQIVTIGSIFSMISILIEKILQSEGNMRDPMIIVIIGAVVNTALDPILIFGYMGFPRLGVAGAAIATITAQAVSLVIASIFLRNSRGIIKISIFDKGFHLHEAVEILKVGLPSMLMQTINSLALFGVNGILAGYSKTAIAVMGIYSKLQIFSFMPVFGINQGALPLIGFNYGAGNKNRVKTTYITSLKMASAITVMAFAIVQIFPEFIMGLFNGKDFMMDMGVSALRILTISFIPAGVGIITATLFQSIGQGMVALTGSIIRQLLGLMLFSTLLNNLIGLNGVWMAFPLAEVIGVSYLVIMVILNRNKLFGE